MENDNFMKSKTSSVLETYVYYPTLVIIIHSNLNLFIDFIPLKFYKNIYLVFVFFDDDFGLNFVV